jgi:hypothetical protein
MARSAFETVIRLQLDKFGPDAARRKHIEIARRGIAAFQSRQTAPVPYTLVVDGHPASSEDAVKPYGLIVYQFNRMGMVAQYALDFLISYVKRAYSGEYHKNFFVSVDGKFIEAKDFNPKFVPQRAEIIIGNKLPFNRKFDVQQIGNLKLSYKVPPGLYDAAAAAVRRRYGKIVDAKREYNINFGGKYKLRREQFHGASMGSRAGRPRNRLGKPVESPGLVITAKV